MRKSDLAKISILKVWKVSLQVSFWRSPIHADIIEFSNLLLNLNIRGLAAKLCHNSFRNKNNRKYYFYFERNYDVLKSKSPCFLFKACARYFLSNSYLSSMIALQKIWKMFFISSKKLFSFSRFCIFPFPSFSPCQSLL